MYASSCINPEIPYLQPEDKGLTALGLLEELKLSEMPLVDNDHYVGIITEMDLLDYECIDGQLSDISSKLGHPFILEDDHIFDAVSKIAADNLSVLPVISADEKYIGAIDQASLIRMISQAEAYRSPGGVIQLEISIHDYSMAEISRLVESNDLKILHLEVNTAAAENMLNVTIKVNKADLTRLIQTFNRFSYNVTASFHKDEYEEDLRKRYESFLKYLNP
ncbi:MAG: CBS domain-containing protein [Vicingaceae bacterium]